MNGMIAANEFRGTDDTSFPFSAGHPFQQRQESRRSQLEIVLNIQDKDWEYNVQPGSFS